jgi:hypothetical protein
MGITGISSQSSGYIMINAVIRIVIPKPIMNNMKGMFPLSINKYNSSVTTMKIVIAIIALDIVDSLIIYLNTLFKL